MSQKNWTLFERYDHLRQTAGRAPVLQSAHYARAEKKSDGLTEFIMSTGDIKRDGFEIVQSGWQIPEYIPAPWRHSTASPRDAMGIWPEVWKSNKGGLALHLRGLLKWNGADHNPDAPYVQKMYDDGVMRACSVRWEEADADATEKIDPKEVEDKNVDWYTKLYGGIRFLRSLLIEGSPCILGMDKLALAQRTRAGGIPKDVLERFVIRPGDKSDQVIEGREVLLLDGHPLRMDVERPEIVDMGARAVAAAVDQNDQPDLSLDDAATRLRQTQRLLRGDGKEGLREALTAAYARAELAAPWDGAMGQSYAGLHEALKSAPEVDVPTLRTAIEKVGGLVFGELRLREAWEPRPLPPGLADLWKPLGESAARVLGRYLSDSVEADAATDALLAEGARDVAPVMDKIAWLGRMVAQISEAAGVEIELGDDATLDAALAAIRTAAVPAEVPADEVLDLWPVVDRVESIRRNRREKTSPAPVPAATVPAVGAQARFNRLIDRLSSPGGDSPSGAD